MRNNGAFSVKIIAAVLACVICMCAVSACQKTPDKPAVVNKQESYEKLVEETAATPSGQAAEPYEAPERWTETIEDGKLTIEIDTEVVLPDTDVYPVTVVEQDVFTQERVNELVGYFANGRRLYRLPKIETKAELEQQIIDAKKYARPDGESAMAGDSEAWIAELEQRYANAPEEDPTEYVDATLTYQMDPQGNVNESSGKNYLLVGFEGGGKDETLSVWNATPEYNSTGISYHGGMNFYEESFYTHNLDAPDIDVETDPVFKDWENQIKNTSMTEEEAAAQAEKVMGDLGIGGLSLVKTEKAAFLNEANNPYKVGYSMVYKRMIAGMTGYDSTFWVWTHYEDEKPPAYAPPFEQEELMLVVNEDGVHLFNWSGCSRVVETLNENAKLLPFDQIQEAAVKQIIYKNSRGIDQFDKARSVVTSAKLCLGYVGVKDDLSKAMIVPVWVFDVDEYITLPDTGEHAGNRSGVAINAIDAAW